MDTVAFVSCTSYDRTAVERAMQQACAWLHGPESFGVQNKRVFLKPNLLTDRTPEEAVTTHPEIVRAVIRLFKAAGAHVTVGDSPANTANLEQVWKKSGIGAVCAEENVPLIALEQAGLTTVTHDGFSFALSTPIAETDLLVNLPKVKSHSLTALTAAVKNAYGVLPGYSKTQYHKRYPDTPTFGRFVAAIWKALPPSISIADGIVGMEGEGPSSGTPIALNFIAAARDPFALDFALCDVLGIAPRRVPYLYGQERPYTCVGERPSIPHFAIPAGQHLLDHLPRWLTRTAGNLVWVRPAFDTARCISCGKCVKACPVEALSLAPATRTPQLRRAICISCSCCHEVCPVKAIRMTRSPLLKMMNVFRGLD